LSAVARLSDEEEDERELDEAHVEEGQEQRDIARGSCDEVDEETQLRRRIVDDAHAVGQKRTVERNKVLKTRGIATAVISADDAHMRKSARRKRSGSDGGCAVGGKSFASAPETTQ
jgi:hypothetical protein